MGFEYDQSLQAVLTIWFSISIAQSLQMSLVGLAYGLIKPNGIWSPFCFGGVMGVVLEWAQGYAFAMNWGRLVCLNIISRPTFSRLRYLARCLLLFY